MAVCALSTAMMQGSRRKRSAFDSRSRSRLRRALLTWYDRHARPLPWRRNRNPYRIWVAEVMLQQTRMAVVLPAYGRFLRAFPTLRRLAEADEDAVLALWSGLGYYNRARAMHRAARLLQSNGGTFPRDLEAALKLPGVGRYTAAAVLSIAFGHRLAAVDGNIIRVLSRLRCLPRPDTRGEPHCSLATDLLDPERPGDWNQSLMELGEVVCLPKAPRCQVCPVRTSCSACIASRAEDYPPLRPRKKTEIVQLQLTVVHDRSGRLLLERGAFPFLPHLWLPPIRVGVVRRPAGAESCGRFHHSIQHRRFEVEVLRRRLTARELDRQARRTRNGSEVRVFDVAEIARIGRSSLLIKACKRALDR